jgi:hypothetical protein
MSQAEIEAMVNMAVRQTVKEVLEELGILSSRIYRQEMIKKIGRRSLERAFRNGDLTPQKDGENTSKVYCNRADFESFAKSLCQRTIINIKY